MVYAAGEGPQFPPKDMETVSLNTLVKLCNPPKIDYSGNLNNMDSSIY